ncbi:AtzG-like protein [Acuticoccus mangrovi]|uniref:DUF4089 domain-containing protein n=1 Tax=Acuticoccus mangrovi TaxID=2796142 RepID=A0A934MNF5_9HYPH|nr:AtzG-like protein [Acuticoccus mangrovi]MBJ3778139.1 DUF4089 domain-containing protein [Acuticoccus mangrovi]
MSADGSDTAGATEDRSPIDAGLTATEALVLDRLSELGVQVHPEWLPAIAATYEINRQMAALVLAEDLDEDDLPAAIFRA